MARLAFAMLCHTGDSEGNGDGSARLPAQRLERDGRCAGSRLAVRCVRVSDDAARTAQQLRNSTSLSTSAHTSPAKASISTP